MSASAEVYVSITTEKAERLSEIVDVWLRSVNLPTTGEDYRKSITHGGDIYEVRGWSVSYEVFDQDWSASLVRELYQLDDSLDVEVYVYNLEREPDASYTTREGRRFMESEKEEARV